MCTHSMYKLIRLFIATELTWKIFIYQFQEHGEKKGGHDEEDEYGDHHEEKKGSKGDTFYIYVFYLCF